MEIEGRKLRRVRGPGQDIICEMWFSRHALGNTNSYAMYMLFMTVSRRMTTINKCI